MAGAMTLIVLGLIEAVLRVLLPHNALLFSWERPDNLIELQSTGEVGVRPKAEDDISDGPRVWHYKTNLQGFRESEETRYKSPDGVLRILAFGDSFMFGINANQGKSLPAQLERLLPAALGAAAVDVINIGVPSSSAFDMLAYWRRFSPVYEFDAVLLGQPHNPGRQQAMQQVRTEWYRDVRGPPPINWRLYMALRRLWAPYTMPAYEMSTEQMQSNGLFSDVAQIAREVHAQGKASWFVLWPTRWETVRQGERARARDWQAVLEPYGTRFVGHTLDTRACWGYSDTGHPSEAGYRATAELLTQLIASPDKALIYSGTPTCDEVGEDGPGLPGSLPVPDGPNLMEQQRMQGGSVAPKGLRGAP